MELKEFLQKVEKTISGENFPVLRELWLKGRKLSDIAKEENITLPAVSYRLKTELIDLQKHLKANPKDVLGKHIKGHLIAPKRDTLLFNMLQFYTAPQRRDLFFPLAYRESGVFLTPEGRKQVLELKAKVPAKDLSIKEIKELFQKLKDEGYAPEVIGFVIRRKMKRKPLPRLDARTGSTVEVEDIYEQLAELQEKVDAVLKEFNRVMQPLLKLLEKVEREEQRL